MTKKEFFDRIRATGLVGIVQEGIRPFVVEWTGRTETAHVMTARNRGVDRQVTRRTEYATAEEAVAAAESM